MQHRSSFHCGYVHAEHLTHIDTVCQSCYAGGMSEDNRTVRARLGKELTAQFNAAMEREERTEPDIVRRAIRAYLSPLGETGTSQIGLSENGVKTRVVDAPTSTTPAPVSPSGGKTFKGPDPK